MSVIYLSTGSNLGDRKANLEKARQLVEELVGRVTAASTILETAPWGFKSRNSFMNQALEVETELEPYEVLRVTQQIERTLGRTTKSDRTGYKDRVIDIDIIMYDDMVMESPQLTIPHPLMSRRRFVLEPLKEIAPGLVHPQTGRSISQMLSDIED